MEIKVIGKRQGISKKSGKQYLQVGYLAPAVNGLGEFGDSIFLDPTEFEYEEIAIGKKYYVEFNRQGFLQSFRPL